MYTPAIGSGTRGMRKINQKQILLSFLGHVGMMGDVTMNLLP